MFKKLVNNKGFVLLESVICLSMITFVLVNLFPAIANMYSIREEQKVEVEMNRYLYDTSVSWDGQQTSKTELYNEWEFNVQTYSNGIEVSDSNNNSIRVELVSVEFQR